MLGSIAHTSHATNGPAHDWFCRKAGVWLASAESCGLIGAAGADAARRGPKPLWPGLPVPGDQRDQPVESEAQRGDDQNSGQCQRAGEGKSEHHEHAEQYRDRQPNGFKPVTHGPAWSLCPQRWTAALIDFGQPVLARCMGEPGARGGFRLGARAEA